LDVYYGLSTGRRLQVEADDREIRRAASIGHSTNSIRCPEAAVCFDDAITAR